MYKCMICGKEYDDMISYGNCVHTCVEAKMKNDKEDEVKKLTEEIEKAFTAVDRAYDYLDYKLKEFEERFPKEFVEHYPDFVDEDDECDEECDGKCDSCVCRKENHCNEDYLTEDYPEIIEIFSNHPEVTEVSIKTNNEEYVVEVER